MTVAAMLLVNNPGSWGAIYPPLAHAAWHGWTPTDLIFPFFLFIVGITTTLSREARRARGADDGELRRQVWRRGGLIILFGLLLAGFPFFTWPPALPEASFVERITDRLAHWRIPGVLQRIGLAYLGGAWLTWRTTPRQQIGIVALLLVGYWALQTLDPVPGLGSPGSLDQPPELLSAWLDRTLFTESHLWSGSKSWDPEGLLSTVPAVGTVMLGTLAGQWIGATARPLTERLAALFAVGALLMVAGAMWGWVFPINKGLWTSSYVLFTAGMAAVALATCLWLIDVQQWRRWTFPFAIYGTNPMLAFLGSGIMARCLGSLWTWEIAPGTRRSAQQAIHQTLFASWLPPQDASLAYAVSFVTVWFLLLWAAWKRGFVLKV